jgi:hypothetical protein
MGGVRAAFAARTPPAPQFIEKIPFGAYYGKHGTVHTASA